MKALRTHLADEEEFVRRVDEVQRPEGYRLIGAFDAEEPAAAAVAGFRVGNNLADGHYLYVDDLATRPEFRRRGLGTALLVWLAREAASPRLRASAAWTRRSGSSGRTRTGST